MKHKYASKYFWLMLLFVLCIVLGACDKVKTVINVLDNTPKVIRIQPFGDMPATEVAYVYQQLLATHDSVVLLKKIDLPPATFYPKRNRYRADSLIVFLKNQTPNGCITIGLTNKDISTTKGKFKDWGVMGLGYCPGKACVVSTFRLSKKETTDQLFKTAIHELGHTYGLPHCPINTCFMRDAEGKNRLNQETDFCAKCKQFLQNKGWKLPIPQTIK